MIPLALFIGLVAQVLTPLDIPANGPPGTTPLSQVLPLLLIVVALVVMISVLLLLRRRRNKR